MGAGNPTCLAVQVLPNSCASEHRSTPTLSTQSPQYLPWLTMHDRMGQTC